MITKIKLNENLILSYKEGLLFYIEKPLDNIEIELRDGKCLWFKNRQLHRDGDLQAILYMLMDKYWFKNGFHHRDKDFPAVEYADGEKHWYKTDSATEIETCQQLNMLTEQSVGTKMDNLFVEKQVNN